MNRGRIAVLIGANGAGKSTLMRCAAGLLRPDAGEIWLDGARLKRPWHDVLLVPETPQVFEDLSVAEHVEFVARSRRTGDARAVDDAVERFGLGDLRTRMGATLSKGQRQRTLLACSAVANPAVLLLDEPFVGLDPGGQREALRLIGELARSDRVVCVSTHLVERAAEIADAVIFMDGGRATSYDSWDRFARSNFGVSNGMSESTA
jgi:ABC-2 type transport system ATP-binding protein